LFCTFDTLALLPGYAGCSAIFSGHAGTAVSWIRWYGCSLYSGIFRCAGMIFSRYILSKRDS
jgi:hypothetical protein